MSEWFKKEAGFRYRVDGNVGLHYMNGDREEYRIQAERRARDLGRYEKPL